MAFSIEEFLWCSLCLPLAIALLLLGITSVSSRLSTAHHLLQSEMTITSQYPEGSSFQLVDMLSYLPAVAGTHERRTSVITMVNHEEVQDINAARIIIGKVGDDGERTSLNDIHVLLLPMICLSVSAWTHSSPWQHLGLVYCHGNTLSW